VTATRFVLVRHGESALAREQRYAGHLDPPLTPEGRAQVRRLGPRFARLGVRRIFSSDLLRCRETAALLAGDAEVVETPELRELGFGRWEGLTADECARRDPETYARWLSDPWRVAPPGGEPLDRLAARVRRVLDRLAALHPGSTVALVTHAGPIRVVLARDPEDFWAPDVPVASLWMCRWPAEGTRR
jgi:alpha-ribazole phosphatase